DIQHTSEVQIVFPYTTLFRSVAYSTGFHPGTLKCLHSNPTPRPTSTLTSYRTYADRPALNPGRCRRRIRYTAQWCVGERRMVTGYTESGKAYHGCIGQAAGSIHRIQPSP